MTPLDDYAFVGYPPMIRPEADEVHISVSFTWDLPLGYALYVAWSQYYPEAKIGGPAFPGYSEGGSIPGVYVKPNIVFTSRGCNNHCPWCLVPLNEGGFRPVPFSLVSESVVIQDNNILQHETAHLGKIMNMLRGCKSVVFAGGLEPNLIDDRVVYMLKNIKIKQLFLSCDSKESIKPLRQAVAKLNGFPRDKLRCFVLLAFNDEMVSDAIGRLQDVWASGCLPFAQLYQPPDRYIRYSKEWRDLARIWSRPAITKAIMR